MVIAAGILDQALGRASGEGGDAIGNALARYRREPAIGDGELRCHVVVVVEKSLVVVAHGALAGQIGEAAGTAPPAPGAAQLLA